MGACCGVSVVYAYASLLLEQYPKTPNEFSRCKLDVRSKEVYGMRHSATSTSMAIHGVVTKRGPQDTNCSARSNPEDMWPIKHASRTSMQSHGDA